MLIVIVLIFIILTVVGILNDIDEFETIGLLGFIVSILALIFVSVQVSRLHIIDDQIAMYQEENTNIEEQFNILVANYQSYEKGTFMELKDTDGFSLINLYPELKADSLVEKQMDIYLSNNETIKELKSHKISGSLYKWWLYFGH